MRRNTFIRAARQIKTFTGLQDISDVSFIYFPHDQEIDPKLYKVITPQHQAPPQLISLDKVNISLKLMAETAKKNIAKFDDITIYFEGGTGDYIMEADVVAVLLKKYPGKRFTILADPSRHCLLNLMLPNDRVTLKPNSRPSKLQKAFIDLGNIVGMDYYIPPYGKTAAYAYIAGLDPKVDLTPIKISALESKKKLALLFPDVAKSKKPIIGLHTTSGNNNAKSWPVEMAPELVKKLSNINHDLLFLRFGGHGEKEINHEKVKECIGLPWDTVAALIKRCSLVVCIDSAIMHIATHSNIPAVTLWGPLRPEHILPTPLCVAPVIGACKSLFCGRYECNDKSCMKTISPDMIVEGVKKIWETAPSARINIQ